MSILGFIGMFVLFTCIAAIVFACIAAWVFMVAACFRFLKGANNDR